MGGEGEIDEGNGSMAHSRGSHRTEGERDRGSRGRVLAALAQFGLPVVGGGWLVGWWTILELVERGGRGRGGLGEREREKGNAYVPTDQPTPLRGDEEDEEEEEEEEKTAAARSLHSRSYGWEGKK